MASTKIDMTSEEIDDEDEDEEKSKNLFVKRTVKNFIKAQDCHSSKSLLKSGALNAAISTLLKAACERAKANSRKTVMAQDL